MQAAGEEEEKRRLEERRTGKKAMENQNNEEVAAVKEPENHEQAMTKYKKIPTLPTQKEIDEHMIHHIPTRSWWNFADTGEPTRRTEKKKMKT